MAVDVPKICAAAVSLDLVVPKIDLTYLPDGPSDKSDASIEVEYGLVLMGSSGGFLGAPLHYAGAYGEAVVLSVTEGEYPGAREPMAFLLEVNQLEGLVAKLNNALRYMKSPGYDTRYALLENMSVAAGADLKSEVGVAMLKVTLINAYNNPLRSMVCNSVEDALEIARGPEACAEGCVAVAVSDPATGLVWTWDWDPENPDAPWKERIVGARERAVAKVKSLLTDDERVALFGDAGLDWIEG